jgi:hypothetical protein
MEHNFNKDKRKINELFRKKEHLKTQSEKKKRKPNLYLFSSKIIKSYYHPPGLSFLSSTSLVISVHFIPY